MALEYSCDELCAYNGGIYYPSYLVITHWLRLINRPNLADYYQRIWKTSYPPMHLRRPEMPGLSLPSIFHLVTSVQPRWFVGDGTNCSCHSSGVTRRLTSEQRMTPSTVRRHDFPPN